MGSSLRAQNLSLSSKWPHFQHFCFKRNRTNQKQSLDPLNAQIWCTKYHISQFKGEPLISSTSPWMKDACKPRSRWYRNSDRVTEWLTGVRCRGTSVAKNGGVGSAFEGKLLLGGGCGGGTGRLGERGGLRPPHWTLPSLDPPFLQMVKTPGSFSWLLNPVCPKGCSISSLDYKVLKASH